MLDEFLFDDSLFDQSPATSIAKATAVRTTFQVGNVRAVVGGEEQHHGLIPSSEIYIKRAGRARVIGIAARVNAGEVAASGISNIVVKKPLRANGKVRSAKILVRAVAAVTRIRTSLQIRQVVGVTDLSAQRMEDDALLGMSEDVLLNVLLGEDSWAA